MTIIVQRNVTLKNINFNIRNFEWKLDCNNKLIYLIEFLLINKLVYLVRKM
jgi:hypothetical protein